MKHAGFTLLEVTVVLVIVTVVLGISVATLRPVVGPDTGSAAVARRARSSALRTGHAVTVNIATDSGTPERIRFLPDGRALGPGVSPLTGELYAR